ELVEERRVGTRLLDRGEVLARHVLDEREEEAVPVVGLAEERGQRVQAGLAGGAPATLTGDALVAAFRTRPDDDRLQDSLMAERRGEARRRLRLEPPARLGRGGGGRVRRPGGGV